MRRAKKGAEPLLPLGKWKRLMDKAIYVVILVSLSLTIPQITTVWIGRDVSGVSVITWTTYALTSAFWLTYGIMHKEKPIILSSIAWVVLYGLVAVGVLVFR